MRAVIEQCGFFSSLDRVDLDKLVGIAQRRRFDAGQMIAQPGQPPGGMYIVQCGQVRVFVLSPTGKEHVLHLAGPGQTFLEVAVLGQFDVPAHCQALEATETVMLPAKALRQLLQSDHRLCLSLLTSMSRWVKQLVGQVEDIALRDAVQRLARYLLNEAEAQGSTVTLPTLKKHLASHLNLTSETLSRSLRRLSEAGAIETSSDRTITLLDTDQLQDIAYQQPE